LILGHYIFIVLLMIFASCAREILREILMEALNKSLRLSRNPLRKAPFAAAQTCSGFLAARVICFAPASARFFQAPQVSLPHLVLAETVLVEQIPGIKPSIMTIGKVQLNGVAAYRFYVADIDIFLSRLEHLLAGRMTTHFSRWRVNTQKFAGKAKCPAIHERNFQQPGFTM
jgi:hypothetical protein